MTHSDFLSFQQLRHSVSPKVVKRLIDDLIEKYGSLREAAGEEGKRFGVSHQTLSNWRSGRSGEIEKMIRFLEKARKDLGISEGEAFQKVVKK